MHKQVAKIRVSLSLFYALDSKIAVMTTETPKSIVPENVRLERAQRGLDSPARHSRVPICPQQLRVAPPAAPQGSKHPVPLPKMLLKCPCQTAQPHCTEAVKKTFREQQPRLMLHRDCRITPEIPSELNGNFQSEPEQLSPGTALATPVDPSSLP